MLFKRKQAKPAAAYDLSRYIPTLRCSICTGEQTAGFKDRETGAFHEIMLIRNAQDLEAFKQMYGVEELQKIY